MQMASSHYSCSINNHYSTLNLNLPQVTFSRAREATPPGSRSVFLFGVICSSNHLPICLRRIGANSRQCVEVEKRTADKGSLLRDYHMLLRLWVQTWFTSSCSYRSSAP